MRRGTAAQWTSANPILSGGELGYETDTGKHKVGNGASAWTALEYFLPEGAIQSVVTTQISGKAEQSHTHNATDTNSGVLTPARLGTGTPDSTKVLYGSGAWGALPATSSTSTSTSTGSVEKRLTADSPLAQNSNNAQSTSPALSIAVPATAGFLYLSGVIYYTSTIVAKMRMQPVFASLTSRAIFHALGSTSTSDTATNRIALMANSGSFWSQAVYSDGGIHVILITGVLIGSGVADTFELKFGQNTAELATNPVILAGSHLLTTPPVNP